MVNDVSLEVVLRTLLARAAGPDAAERLRDGATLRELDDLLEELGLTMEDCPDCGTEHIEDVTPDREVEMPDGRVLP